MACGGSALPGRPGLGTWRGKLHKTAPPSPHTKGKAGAGGVGSRLWVSLEVDLLEWGLGRENPGIYAGSPAGRVGAGSGQQSVLLINSGW